MQNRRYFLRLGICAAAMCSTKTLHANIVVRNLLDEAYCVHGSGSNKPGFGVSTGITASL